MESHWRTEESVLYRLMPSGCCCLAAFDMDSTLIKTKSGAKFAKSRDDWDWWDPSVPDKLRELHSQGMSILIFTNQSGIEKKRADPAAITGKIDDVIQELDIPVTVFIATAADVYRKPAIGMLKMYCDMRGSPLNYEKSFYCGDAAGRPKRRGAPRDFSCSDRKFAMNCGLMFFTPEEFFLGQPAPEQWDWRSTPPEELFQRYTQPQPAIEADMCQEMIVLVGSPASGKTTVARSLEDENTVWINQDTLKTKAKCIKACREALRAGQSVIIDRTNPKASDRAEFIALASEIPLRCVWMATPREMSDHMNLYRERSKGVRRIPDVVLNTYYSRLEEPTTTEGFTEIIKLQPCLQFDSEEDRKLFLQWG